MSFLSVPPTMYKLSSHFQELWQALDNFRTVATYWIMNNIHTIAAAGFCLLLLILTFVLLAGSELI